MLRFNNRPIIVERAALSLSIATEAWAVERTASLGYPIHAWLYGHDHAQAHWNLEITVDDKSSAGGAPAPALRMPIDGAAFPTSLDALAGVQVTEAALPGVEAFYGNDVPPLENNTLRFGNWLDLNTILLQWTADCEDWDGQPGARHSFAFEGPVQFRGIHMTVKKDHDAVPFLSHTLPNLERKSLAIDWGREIHHGSTMPKNRRHWREVSWTRRAS